MFLKPEYQGVYLVSGQWKRHWKWYWTLGFVRIQIQRSITCPALRLRRLPSSHSRWMLMAVRLWQFWSSIKQEFERDVWVNSWIPQSPTISIVLSKCISTEGEGGLIWTCNVPVCTPESGILKFKPVRLDDSVLSWQTSEISSWRGSWSRWESSSKVA